MKHKKYYFLLKILGDTANGIVVYPNPSQGMAIVQIPETFGNAIQITIVELGSGKIVNNLTTSFGATELNFSAMANGVYIINVTSEEGTSTHRLILAK